MTRYDAFLAHVEEDRAVIERVAEMLEAAGCRTWYYERDSLPGDSYLRATRTAIDESRCVLVFASLATQRRSHQVDKEVVHAHESGKRIIPVLIDTRFSEFRRSHPEWHQASGAVVGVELTTRDPHHAIDRLLLGLRALGIGSRSPDGADTAALESDAGDIDGDPIASPEPSDASVALSVDARDAPELRGDPTDHAVVVHEHESSGLFAEVIVTGEEQNELQTLQLVLQHPRIGSMPRRISVNLAKPYQATDGRSPIEYFRITGLAGSLPVMLRVYWLQRLPPWSMFRKSFGIVSAPAVGTESTATGVLATDAAGLLAKGAFVPIVDRGNALPCIVTRRLRTTRKNQRAISIAPAVRHADGRIRVFPPLKVTVPPAPAGVAWLEFRFRVDVDGCYLIIARDPLASLAVRDLVVVQ